MRLMIATTAARRILVPFAIAAAALTAVLALQYSPGHAQEPDVTISSLDCTGDPEVVTITNSGDDAVDLDGWSLESDPAASETFDLTSVGELASGASINVQSGPEASGTLVWSEQEIFRDDDASDFARLVDDTGATQAEVACAEATPTASPAPSPTAAPTIAPTSTPGNMPNGGGPPSPGSGPLTGLIFAGAGVSAIALVAVASTLAPVAGLWTRLVYLRGRREAPERPDAAVAGRLPLSRGSWLLAGIGLALVILVITLAIGARSRR